MHEKCPDFYKDEASLRISETRMDEIKKNLNSKTTNEKNWRLAKLVGQDEGRDKIVNF